MSKILFGNPFNIKEETCYPSRAALIEAKLHRYTVHGIDGNGNKGVAAIVLSGGYEDDQDFGDEIVYTGHGGNDPQTKKQIEHQSWDSYGNKGLVVSKIRNLPVRVIRGFKHNSPFSPKSGYKYCGLFRVEDNWEEIGKSGFKICRFRLKKIDFENQTPYVEKGTLVKLEVREQGSKWFSIGVDAPNSQKISEDSKMAQELLGKKKGEFVDFGNGFHILEIKNYLS